MGIIGALLYNLRNIKKANKFRTMSKDELLALSDDEFNELVNYVAKSRAKNKALVVKAMEEIRQKRSANQVLSTPVTPNVEPKKDDAKKGDDAKTDEYAQEVINETFSKINNEKLFDN